MQNPPIFAIAIAGSGAAGLSLAMKLAESPAFSDKPILLIDRQSKQENDRTWCFWTTGQPPFSQILANQWHQVRFQNGDFDKVLPLGPLTYNMLKSVDFYRYCLSELRQRPNFHFVQGDIVAVESHTANAAITLANGQSYLAEWVFDSRADTQWLQETTAGHNLILQHFKGWVIETEAPVFQPDTPQLFDFNIPQQNEVRFMYILPESAHKALVEFTIFSPNVLTSAAYEAQLAGYLQEKLGGQPYQILEIEQGVIPMTDYPFPRFEGPRHINIGTRGGACKASTGYAFLRIQREATMIVKTLAAGKQNFGPSVSHPRFALYDAMILDLMQRDGGKVGGYFTDMFSKNPAHRVLRFLDEQTSFREELQIMASVPVLPFSLALFRNAKILPATAKVGNLAVAGS